MLKRKLYDAQLSDVLVDELNAKKILCISDTTDVLLDPSLETASIAHTLERAKLGPHIEVLQTDYVDFHFLSEEESVRFYVPQFGACLPQNQSETRREYLKVDATTLKADLSAFKTVDVVLGRSCLCACKGDGKLCGGIDISTKAQQDYLEAMIELKPSLVVLSASGHMLLPSDERDQGECEEQERAQSLYREARSNMRRACENLNKKEDNPYKLVLIELAQIERGPKHENGYIIVAYDTRNVDFQLYCARAQTEVLIVLTT